MGIPLVDFVEDPTCAHTIEILICMVSFTVRFDRSGLMHRRRSRILRGGKGISAYLTSRKGAAEPLH